MTAAGGVFVAYLHPYNLTASFSKSLDKLKYFDLTRETPRIVGWGAVQASANDLPGARNTVAQHVLEEPRFEWLMWIDADMGFLPDSLDRLLEVADPVERPIVGGLCFAYKEQGFDGFDGVRALPKPTIWTWVPEANEPRGVLHYPVNQLIWTWGTGCAFVLVHRSVIERIHEAYGPSWYDRLPHPKQNVGDGPYGEDISFHIRTNALEIPSFIHTGVRTTHQKTIFVQEDDFWQSFHAPPATERVDVVVPTVAERIGNLPALLASLKASTGLATPIVVVDDEDHAAAVKAIDADAVTLIQPGRFPVKVNAGYRFSTAPWIQVVGDDCQFQPGWLDHQQRVADLYNAKVVGSNDLANPRVIRGEHATHWMIARDYIEEQGASWDGPGVVAHEGYRHWFCDDEIVTAAKQRGVFQPALGAVIAHHHPITGLAAYDDVYKRNDTYADRDRKLFLKRHAAHV